MTPEEIIAARNAWYASRADWHGKMAAYCVKLATKRDRNYDALAADNYENDAVIHARSAWVFAVLAMGWGDVVTFIPYKAVCRDDVGADVPGGGAC